MKKGEKILILALIIILVVVIVKVKKNKGNEVVDNNGGTTVVKQDNKQAEEEPVVEEYVDVLADGTKLNTSESLKKDKTVDGLAFTNIQLTNSNGQSVLLADVENTTGEATELTLVDVIFVNENGDEIGKVGGIISPLEPGAKTQFNTSMTIDYSNVYDFQIVKKAAETVETAE